VKRIALVVLAVSVVAPAAAAGPRHADHHEQADGLGGTFGNWCEPARLWIVDPSP
jgi:hypothetical protein